MPPRLIHAGLLAPRRSGVQYHLCNLQRVAVAHKQHFAAAVCRLDARDERAKPRRDVHHSFTIGALLARRERADIRLCVQ